MSEKVRQSAVVYQMREFTDQQQKCLHGEHEADAGSPACADGLNLTWRAPDGLKRIVCVCKYCRCLFVEKA